MDDFEVLSDGADIEELGADDLGESTWYGTGAGNTIILPVTATPSPEPASVVDPDLQKYEEVNEKLLQTLDSINEHLENEQDGSEENMEDSRESEGEEEGVLSDPEAEQEQTSATLDDLLTELQSIHADFTEYQEIINIHNQNSELYAEFTLGFIVSMFFGFVIYCFLGRVR